MKRRFFFGNIGVCFSILSAGCLDGNSEQNRTSTEKPEQRTSQGNGEPITARAGEINPTEYDTTDRNVICLLEAGNKVLQVIESELGVSLRSVRFALSSETGVTITLSYEYSRDGDLIESPNVDFEEVVAVTPASVTMSVEISGDTYECTDEVTVREVYGQEV